MKNKIVINNAPIEYIPLIIKYNNAVVIDNITDAENAVTIKYGTDKYSKLNILN